MSNYFKTMINKKKGTETVSANTEEGPIKRCYFKEAFKQTTMQNGRKGKEKRIASEICRNVCSKGFISV